MEFQIKPYHKNTFESGGILIKDPSVMVWIKEIQDLKLSLEGIQIFPVPNTIANTIWGCLIIPLGKINGHYTGKHELCQRVSTNLFIPERAVIHPTLAKEEIDKIFRSNIHIIHPEFGLVELEEALNIESLLIEPAINPLIVTKPLPSVKIPGQIKSFQIQPVSPEEILKNLEENVFPKREKMKDEPLNLLEKGKLAFYKLLFTKTKTEGSNSEVKTEKTSAWSKFIDMVNSISKKENKWFDKLQDDFEDLDKRNQKQIDKLMDLFKNDPLEALKYAIPLDGEGSSRGFNNGRLDWTKRWFDFSLFGNLGGSGSGAINLGEHYYILQNQYHATAEALIKQKEFQKAAFVYMKLLKNYYKAAETLESGNHFQEAATIFLKHGDNKLRAAQCYEKGKMIKEAIDLYKDLNENEKVGDLYVDIHKRKEANVYYEKVVDDYKSKNQYVKASLIYKYKMENELGGQSLLLEGWRNKRDGVNCLNNYFSNIKDIKVLNQEINSVYSNDVEEQNREMFLQVIRYEYDKKNELADGIREIAYEIIAAQVAINPHIVLELKSFNITDKKLMKDTMRFTMNKGKGSKSN